MAKRKRKSVKATTSVPATDADGKPSAMVDVVLTVPVEDIFVAAPTGGGKERDPELYELQEHGGVRYYAPTHKRAEQLRELYQEHVKVLEPDFGWKGAVEAVVPAAIAADVREAMDFMGSIVDDEYDEEGGKVRLFSEGYYAHGFDGC